MDKIYSSRIVPVCTFHNVEHALGVAGALSRAGLPVMEITLRTPRALDCVRAVRSEFPEMLIGTGTVLNLQQVEEAREAGSAFGVAPGLHESVVAAAQAKDWPFIPGVQTASEIERALQLGCRLLKFFPAEPAGGVPMLKALAAPYAHLGARFIPLGGVTPETAPSWLALPAVAAIGGSWLVQKADLDASDWDAVETRAREALSLG